jgi:hypothetical protein
MIKATIKFKDYDGQKVMLALSKVEADIIKCKLDSMSSDIKITFKVTTYDVVLKLINHLNLTCIHPIFLLNKKEIKK